MNWFLYYYFGYYTLKIVDKDPQKYILLLLQVHCICPFANAICCSTRCIKPPASHHRVKFPKRFLYKQFSILD